ncbi:phosphoserine phosphatase RsbU [bacterium BMS3Abin04]|nr:phosphoserine phosphatase RsbU [bacterium BMS3Abin04]
MHLQDQNSALKNLSALVDFSNLVNSSLDLDFTLNNILFTCFAKLQITKGVVLFVEDNKLNIKSSKGFVNHQLDDFPEISIDNFEADKKFKTFLKQHHLQYYIKIQTASRFIGLIILGEKLNKKPYLEKDKDFLTTLINIGSTAIENSLAVERLKEINKTLDSKINQLSSLFDLSKEFSGIIEEKRVSKLLVFSVIAQMLVSKFALVTCENRKPKVLESRIPVDELENVLGDCLLVGETEPLDEIKIKEKYSKLWNLGIVLAIPMLIKGETKGLILLGKRLNNLTYTKSDIEYVSSVGGLAIISIENSRLFKEAIEKQKMEKDLEIAKNIQQNLLPSSIPKLEEIEISAYNKTARQVGGDYYDLIKLNDKELLLAIADVSGKGVQAALLMANLQAFLKSIVKQNIPLVHASNLINDLVSENTTNGSFITFFWGKLNLETKVFEYVNAGHNPPLLLRNGEIIKLKKGGMILGVMNTVIPYESEKVSLKTDDVIVLFTDGITEAMNTKNEEYSDERLEELSLQKANASSEEILNAIIDDIHEHTWDAEQSDDITCLVIKVK